MFFKRLLYDVIEKVIKEHQDSEHCEFYTTVNGKLVCILDIPGEFKCRAGNVKCLFVDLDENLKPTDIEIEALDLEELQEEYLDVPLHQINIGEFITHIKKHFKTPKNEKD